jgi:hypothetical protein
MPDISAETTSRNTKPRREPAARLLRAFAFDPSLATELENFDVSEVTIRVRWEPETKPGPRGCEPCFGKGPVGEYLEVVDVDPASQCAYEPVDLNQIRLVAEHGLAPSEGNPQFHQQMVYAVAMKTIQHFEDALGREVFWSDLRVPDPGGDFKRDVFKPVRRLRIYPHALREENAYYDPSKKALLFGYFPAHPELAGLEMPGGMVFACLSHDVIAHETTHAILDGMQRYFLEAGNSDGLAFHEAFADLVALFQHFTYPEILARQLQRARGDLETETILGQLAMQFGKATGGRGALRDAIGEVDKTTKEWKRRKPDPSAVAAATEPHLRGSFLVAAVFDAFLAIYRHRTRDLIRIATGGTGILPAGDLHPDLVNRLATEAAKTAEHVLLMCIRAIDYCPPVDITFGDYLRALITADFDLVPDDARNYRVAFIEAFRKWAIYPHDVRTLSVESLRWQPANPEMVKPFVYRLKRMREIAAGDTGGTVWDELRTGATRDRDSLVQRRLTRNELYDRARKVAAALHENVKNKARSLHEQEMLEPGQSFLGLNVRMGHEDDRKFAVATVRPVRRQGPDGRTREDLLVQLTQQRPGYFDEARQKQEDARYQTADQNTPPDFKNCDFVFRGGATFVVDLDTFEVRYAIYKDILSQKRMQIQRNYAQSESNASLRQLYFGRAEGAELLAQLHSCE